MGHNEAKVEELCASIVHDAADIPDLAELFARRIATVKALPGEAFSPEGRPWLAKLIGDTTSYTSTAMCVADGLVATRGELLQEMVREMRIDLNEARPPPRKRKGRKK